MVLKEEKEDTRRKSYLKRRNRLREEDGNEGRGIECVNKMGIKRRKQIRE
jgi:hypothetical protein